VIADPMAGEPDKPGGSRRGDGSSFGVFDGARPDHQGDLAPETAGMAPVPLSGRYGATWRNFTVWFGPNMELSGVFTGTLVFTLGLGFWPGLAAMLIGVALGALPVALLALWGPKTGMAQLPLARLPFGRSIALPALVQWFSAIAWDALVGLFGGEAVQILFHVPFFVGVLIVLGLEGAVGILGYEFIHQLEAWGSAILLVLFAILTVKIIQHGNVPMHSSVHGTAAVGIFILVTTITFSGSFSWASYAADYSRYMKPDASGRGIFWATFAGLFISLGWMYTIGLAGAKSLSNQTAAGVQSLMGGGFLGVLALLAIIFGSVTGTAMNDYSGSLAVQAGGVRIRRPVSAGLATVLVFFLVLWIHGGDTAAKFQNVLLFTAYWIAPFFAVILIDWYRRGQSVSRARLLESLDFKSLGSGWPALVALVVGFAAMVPFMNTGIIEGPAATALAGADISFYVGFIVAGAVYFPLRNRETGRARSVPNRLVAAGVGS
jgi:NCS1 family nucleobase:cation symporter-1